MLTDNGGMTDNRGYRPIGSGALGLGGSKKLKVASLKKSHNV